MRNIVFLLFLNFCDGKKGTFSMGCQCGERTESETEKRDCDLTKMLESPKSKECNASSLVKSYFLFSVR